MQPHTDDLFDSTEVNIAMNNIIKLFNNDVFIQEALEKEKQISILFSKLIKDSNGEAFLANFSDEAKEDLTSFYSDGIITPNNFPIKDHLRGIAKVFDDNNIKIQTILNDYIKEIEDNKKKYEQFDVKVDIIEELKLINKMFPYDVYRKAWKFPLFTLTHQSDEKQYEVEFDGIYFKFDFHHSEITSAMRIVIDNETANYEHYSNSDDEDKYVHPHIGLDQKICFGDAGAAAQLFWERKELFNLAMLMADTLGHYNHSSPYRSLRQWADKKLYDCVSCGGDVNEDHVLFLGHEEIPENAACPDCAFIMDGRVVWKDDYVYSSYHGKHLLKTHATIAWTSQTEKNYISNILANPDFVLCPGCNEFSLATLFNQGDGISKCERCQNKEVNAA